MFQLPGSAGFAASASVRGREKPQSYLPGRVAVKTAVVQVTG